MLSEIRHQNIWCTNLFFPFGEKKSRAIIARIMRCRHAKTPQKTDMALVGRLSKMNRTEEEERKQAQQRKQQPQENVSEISHDREAHDEAVQPANHSTEARADVPTANGMNGAPIETSNVSNSNVSNSNVKLGKPPDESPGSRITQKPAANIVRSTDPQLVGPLYFCMYLFKTFLIPQNVWKNFVCYKYARVHVNQM